MSIRITARKSCSLEQSEMIAPVSRQVHQAIKSCFGIERTSQPGYGSRAWLSQLRALYLNDPHSVEGMELNVYHIGLPGSSIGTVACEAVFGTGHSFNLHLRRGKSIGLRMVFTNS